MYKAKYFNTAERYFFILFSGVIMYKFTQNIFIFFSTLILGAVCGYFLMYEYKWDLANYHYYNPWAFLHDRLGYDIAPASVNTYFNPLLDLPFYFMVEYLNDFPKIVSALQGCYYGVLVFVVFKIAELFFSQNYQYKNILIFFSVLIGVTGFATFMQISTTSNEMQISILVLCSFYILLKTFYDNYQTKGCAFFLAGFLLGAAAGLKLTAIIYCVSSFLTLLFFRKKIIQSKLMIVLFCVGGGIGFLLINGFWMWKLWELFDNPIFPFGNRIFQSEYFDDFNFSDRRFIPKTLAEYLFYPFFWGVHFAKRVVAETYFIDFRFAAVYLILLFYLCRFFYKKIETTSVRFLFVYIVISYLIWLLGFSIIRYAIPIEVLTGIVIVKFAYDTFPQGYWNKVFAISALIVILFIFVSTPMFSVPWGTRARDAKIIDVEDIAIHEDDVILLYNMPSAAVVPTIISGDSKVRVIGTKQGNVVVMGGTDFTERKKFRLLREKLLENKKGKIIAIIREWYNSLYNVDWKKDIYLKNLSCRKLKNNLDEHLFICR